MRDGRIKRAPKCQRKVERKQREKIFALYIFAPSALLAGYLPRISQK